jgi:hypothetical protein
MMASRKIKMKVKMGAKETKRFREQDGPFGSGRFGEEKMDDISKIIKELSNKISKMELDQDKTDPFAKRDRQPYDNDQEPHLTRHDYERSLHQEPLFGNEVSINNMGDSDYQGIVDSIMTELQKKYNLRPRDKISTIDSPNKILSRSKKNEISQPSTEKIIAKTKMVETQDIKMKID